MLLSACLNTIGWPKERWCPDHVRELNMTEHSSTDLTVHTPLTFFERIDWAEDMRAGLALVGGVPQLDEVGLPTLTGGAADEIAGAIAASIAFFALTRLLGMYQRSPPDWLNVWDTPYYMTGIQTRINESIVQSLSVQSQRIVELFKYHQDHGKTFAKTATGFHGTVYLTVPSLRTTCDDVVNDGAPGNNFDIHNPDDNSASFALQIGPSGRLSFAGASCTVTFSQALAPVETWIVDLRSPWMGFHNISAPVGLRSLPIDTASADALITARLAAHFTSMMPMLHGQVPSFGVVPHPIMAARMLQAQHPEFGSDTASMAAVVVTLTQQQFSTASWTLRAREDILISSAPVHWQLYGSGPRMKWEWLAITALLILLLVMINHIGLLLVFRFQAGAWLDLGGMLRAANRTPRTLPSVDRVHLAGSLRAREDVVKNADDMVRYKITAVENQWPELVQCPSEQDWAMRRRKIRHRHAQSTDQPTTPFTMQNRPAPDPNIGLTVNGSSSGISTAATQASRSSSSVPSTAPPQSMRSNIPLLAVDVTSRTANASTSSLDSTSNDRRTQGP